MSGKKRLHFLDTSIGALFCTSAAALLAYFLHGTDFRLMVPLLFLGIVTVVALRYGVAAGVIGSLASAAIFAIFLFAPAGSIKVSGDARTNLGWLLLGGISLSFLFAPPQRD